MQNKHFNGVFPYSLVRNQLDNFVVTFTGNFFDKTAEASREIVN